VRRRAPAAAVAVLVAAALLYAGSRLLGGGGTATARAVPTALARIVRTDVVERNQVSGTLDFPGSFTVADAGPGGVVTWLPAEGSIVRRGRPLFALDHVPVVLLYGGTSAYRDLGLGTGAGADVREMQRNLRALGFSAGGALAVDGRFDLATLAAVEAWQRSLGIPPTGTVPLGSVVFLPGPVRVATAAVALGASVQAGAAILSATAPEPAVLVPLDPGSVGRLAAGDPVLVTMPDGTAARGRVATIGRVATAPPASGTGGGGPPATPTIPVTVRLLHPPAAGALDQAPVQVAITTQEDRHVLAAPIGALLARPGGGYAVQLPTGRLVAVTTGLFDDVAGRVEIAGAGLRPGTRVEVPAG
jgi:peptidoglycan hydrolase-like protein with peptidoglycan-binding domain